MFRLVASAASNPPLGADSHTTDFGGRYGSLATAGDYGNSVLVGLQAYLLRQLHRS